MVVNYMNIDIIKPVWKDIDENSDDVVFTRRENNDEIDSVTIYFSGTDKYLDVTDIDDDFVQAFEDEIEIYTYDAFNQRELNTTIKKDLEVFKIYDEDRTLINGSTDRDVPYEVRYKLVLTNTETYSGKVEAVVRKERLYDEAGLMPDEDKVYTVSLVDFIKPTIEKTIEGTEYSKIPRLRDGADENANTVQLKITGFDKHIDQTYSRQNKNVSVFDNDDITIYFGDTKVTDDDKDILIQSITEVKNTENTIEYVVILGNFNSKNLEYGSDYSGEVYFEIAEDVFRDRSENKNLALPKSGVGNPNWIEPNEDDQNSPIYTAFRQNIVDFIYPEIKYKSMNVDYNAKTVTVKFTTTDKFFLKSNLQKEHIKIIVGDLDATAQLYADGKSSLTSEEIENGIEYTLLLENFDAGEILAGSQYTDYSGYLQLIFQPNVIIDTSGNKNNQTSFIVRTDNNSNIPVDVDVVDPVWNKDNLIIDHENDIVTVDLLGTDKYYKKHSLDLDKITVYVDGELAESITKEFVVLDEKTGATEEPIRINLNGAQGAVIGVRRKLKLSGFEQQGKQDGKQYKEWSGNLKIVIAAETLEDSTTNTLDGVENINKNVETTFDLGYVDFVNPLFEKLESSVNATETTAPTTVTYKFMVTDKYFKQSYLTEGNRTVNKYIDVYVDGELANDTTMKNIDDVQPVYGIVAGEEKKIGEIYTLKIFNFKQNTRQEGKKYLEWSGNVEISIDEKTVIDNADNGNDFVPDMYGGYVDEINPEFTYVYSDLTRPDPDIDYESKTLTVEFDITDKYFKRSALSEYITANGITDPTTNELWAELTDASLVKIAVDGNENADTEVTKKIMKMEDIKVQVDGKEQKVGEKYKLVISNLEQLKRKDGENYKDYSGPMQITFAPNIAEDNGNIYENGKEPLTNKSVGKTITIGIDDPDSSQDDEVIVDVVDPVWEKQYATVDFNTETDGKLSTSVELVINATDKYFKNSILTNSNVKEYITIYDGNKDITKDVGISFTQKELTESRGQQNVQYGIEYTITVSNFPTNANQISAVFAEDILEDISGNKNIETEKILLFNTLRATDKENSDESKFLGMDILRKSVEGIVFEDNIDAAIDENGNLKDNVWDVSAFGDKSILAWYGNDNIVHIGSISEIYANQNSSYLFANVGREAKTTGEFKYQNSSLLHTVNVTDMSYMYEAFGSETMKELSLGTNFDTRNVTSMKYMFSECGFKSMEWINLGAFFETKNVQDMSYMFYRCGYMSMTSLDLEANFYATKVQTTEGMFKECGYTSMTSLNLRENFRPEYATTMEAMFWNCGYLNLIKLDLGDQFSTANVQNMKSMFRGLGNKKLVELRLGARFITNNVTNMDYMFTDCGTEMMTTLDLGPSFERICENTIDFVTNCGKNEVNNTKVLTGEAIWNDEHNFKLNKEVERLDAEDTVGLSSYINYKRGKINPVYTSGWTKISSEVVAKDTMNIVIQGRGIYAKYKSDNLPDKGSDIRILIDNEEADTIYDDELEGLTDEQRAEALKNKILIAINDPIYFDENLNQVKKDQEGVIVESVQYTVTLTNFEQPGRKLKQGSTTEYKDYTEWSGNVTLIIPENTLVDEIGNGNLEIELREKDDGGKDNDIKQNTENMMFIDHVKPEISYDYSNKDIDKDVLIVRFKLTDKYFSNSNITADNIKVKVEGELLNEEDEELKLVKNLSIINPINETINNKTQLVGEEYVLYISGFDQLKVKEGDSYKDYSGPVNLIFDPGIITDLSGNTSNGKTITIGVDDPNPPGTDDDSEIVDLVAPTWHYIESKIYRERTGAKEDSVEVFFKGMDKYMDPNSRELQSDEVKIQIAGKTVDSVPAEALEGKTSKEIAELTKDKVVVKVNPPDSEDDYIKETRTEHKIVDGVEYTETVEAVIGIKYSVTVTNFGSDLDDYGDVQVLIPIDTLKDLYGNTNKEGMRTTVGNSTWVELDDDPTNPKYKAFSESFVDFERPYFEYKSCSIEDIVEPNPVAEAEDEDEDEVIEEVEVRKKFVVKFKVVDKQIQDIMPLGVNTLREKDYMNIVVDKADNAIQTLTTNLTKEDEGDGTLYTLEISDFEALEVTPNYPEYSGPIQLVFTEGAISDTSGNKNLGTSITINEPDIETGEEGPVIVDFIKPEWRVLEEADTEYHSKIFRKRVNENAIEEVVFYLQASDKYLSENDITDLVQKRTIIETYIDERRIYPTKTVEFVKDVYEDRTSPDGKDLGKHLYGRIYKVTLTNFSRYNGTLKIIVPENTITDEYGNKNEVSELYLLNKNWIELDDNQEYPQYKAFSEGIVDYQKPTWVKEKSVVDKEKGTVTLTLAATDRHYKNDSLTEKDITIYTKNEETGEFEPNDTITKKVSWVERFNTLTIGNDAEDAKITTDTWIAEEKLNGNRYKVTLGNFGTYEGVVKYSIAENTIEDTSGNKNVETSQIGVGYSTGSAAFQEDIVDFVKPVITILDECTIVDEQNETITFEFEATDTYLYTPEYDYEYERKEALLSYINVYIDGQLAYDTPYKEGEHEADEDIRVSMNSITEIENGYRYKIKLSNFQLDDLFAEKDYLFHSGTVQLVVNEGFVRDTSNNNNETKDSYVKEADGTNKIIDFVNPVLFIANTKVDTETLKATIVVKCTDRFFDFESFDALGLGPDDMVFKDRLGVDLKDEYKENFKCIETNKIEHGYEYIFEIYGYENDEIIYVEIEPEIVVDLYGNTNEKATYFGIIDFKKPEWEYLSALTERTQETVDAAWETYRRAVESNAENASELRPPAYFQAFEIDETGRIELTVKARDLDIVRDVIGSTGFTPHLLEPSDLKVYRGGADVTASHTIKVYQTEFTDRDPVEEVESGTYNPNKQDDITYIIVVEGFDLENEDEYTLVFNEGSIEDYSGNLNNTTTLTLSKSILNSDRFTNVRYYQSAEYLEKSRGEYFTYVNEPHTIGNTGTNENSSRFMLSTIYDLYLLNKGIQTEEIFKEPFEYNTETGIQDAKVLKGWSLVGNDGKHASDLPMEERYCYNVRDDVFLFNILDKLYLRPVWKAAQVIFVSSSIGSNLNDGLSPETPVQTVENALEKLGNAEDMTTQLIVIMDEVEWGPDTVDKNVTITSFYAGIDYKEQGAVLKITGNISMEADMTIENIKVDSTSETVSKNTGNIADATYENLLIANYNDLILGRHIESSDGKYTFGAVIGGNNKTLKNVPESGTQTIKVESGRYNNIIVGSTLTNQTEIVSKLYQDVAIGSKKEAPLGSNDYLDITGYLTLGQNEKSSNTDKRAKIDFYGGIFTGDNLWNPENSDDVNAAIYLRQPGEDVQGNVILNVYNGIIRGSVYSGESGSNSDREYELTNMHFYGGTIENGGNLYALGIQDYTGKTEFYMTGQFNMYGGGDVYGGVHNLGKTRLNVNSDTKIEIASNLITIEGDIYGGSNGEILQNGTITIDITGMEAAKNIYGGSNGSTGVHSEVNLTMHSGDLEGNIYGGSKSTDDVKAGDVIIVNMDISGGKAKTLYASGKESLVHEANITFSQPTERPTEKNAVIGPEIETVYGGADTEGLIVDKVVMNLNSGKIGVLYAGGNKVKSNKAIVTIDGAEIGTVYGGPNAYETKITDDLLMDVSNITMNSGKVTGNIYGGGNHAKVNTSNITINGGTINGTIYGGSNKENQIVDKSNITINGGSIKAAYGGGENVEVTIPKILVTGGTTQQLYGSSYNGKYIEESDIKIIGGTVVRMYGGGRSSKGGATAQVGTSNILVDGGRITHLYGGGYAAHITKVVNINVVGSASSDNSIENIYGGSFGKDSNGKPIVLGTKESEVPININIGKVLVAKALNKDVSEFTSQYVKIGNIYGAGRIGEELDDVNYNAIGVYGEIRINVDGQGYDASKFAVRGVMQGAGKGLNYNHVSLAGEGNQNTAIIDVKNMGSMEYIQLSTAIQRADQVYIEETYLELEGVQDAETVELLESNYLGFTLYKIDSFTMYNTTQLYLRKNIGIIREVNSFKDRESNEKETVTFTNATYPKVQSGGKNRIYAVQENNLWFANTLQPWLQEDGTVDWSDINGVIFFGQYAFDRDTPGSVLYDIYHPEYSEDIDKKFYQVRATVYAKHKQPNHDVYEDGFYTNVGNDNYTDILSEYMLVKDWDGTRAYQWYQKEPIQDEEKEVEEESVTLIGKTYQYDQYNMVDYVIKNINLETGEISNYPSGTIFRMKASVNSLVPGIEYIHPNTIPVFASGEESGTNKANTSFAVEIEGVSGWQKGKLSYIDVGAYSQTAKVNGDAMFVIDDAVDENGEPIPPVLRFRLSSSLNVTANQEVGNISFTLIPTGEDGTVYEEKNIVLKLRSRVEKNGLKYVSKFKNSIESSLDYTTDSKIDLTFTLYNSILKLEENAEAIADMYTEEDYRVLSFSEPLPAGTKITLVDYNKQNKAPGDMYYYNVTEPISTISLSEFTNMAYVSTSSKKYIDDSLEKYFYEDDKLDATRAVEKFEVSLDFKDANLTNVYNGKVKMNLIRGNEVKYGQTDEDSVTFTMRPNRNAQMTLNTLTRTYASSIGKGDLPTLVEQLDMTFNLNANLKEVIYGNKLIDTKYHNKVFGVAVELVDSLGKRIELSNNDRLTSTVAGTTHYSENINGILRLPLTDTTVTTINNDINLTLMKKNIVAGEYKLKVYLYTSDDGKFYPGDNILAASMATPYEGDRVLAAEFPIMIITSNVGYKVDMEVGNRVVYSGSRKDFSGTDNEGKLNFKVTLGYDLENTYVTMKLYKRNATYNSSLKYQEVKYTEIDAKDYFVSTLVKASDAKAGNTHPENEYFVDDITAENAIDFSVELGENIDTGEYKVEFNLYSNEGQSIQTDKKTFVVVD